MWNNARNFQFSNLFVKMDDRRQILQHAEDMAVQQGEGVYGGGYQQPPSYYPPLEKQPPPYEDPSNNRNVPCDVCRTPIPLPNNQRLLTVRCPTCNEETAVGSPPPGQKFVRCSCNLLIICRTEFQSVHCPRESCQKLVTLIPTPATFILNSGITRIVCATCCKSNQVNVNVNKFVKCYFCGKTSAIASRHRMNYGVLFTLLSLLFFVIGLIINLFTNNGVPSNTAIILTCTICLAFYVATIASFVRGVWYLRMKVSCVISPIR